MKDYWVYMLRCSDGSYYTGVTNDMQRRLAEHARGSSVTAYVYGRRPFTLVYSCIFGDIGEAISWEKQIKDWSRTKKKPLSAAEQHCCLPWQNADIGIMSFLVRLEMT